MKTNPYPYAGNNPVNFVGPMGLDYTYWDRPFDDTFCRNTVYEDCGYPCVRVHAWTDCFPISTPVYYRFVTDDSFYAVKNYDPGECHECWTGYCYDACRHLVPPGGPNECVIVNEEEVMQCLSDVGCIFDFPFWIPIVDGNQPNGGGEKFPNPADGGGLDPSLNPPLFYLFQPPYLWPLPIPTQPPTPGTGPGFGDGNGGGGGDLINFPSTRLGERRAL